MPQVPAPISEADYEAIEAAVMETERGRWFLSEYARRNRHADTLTVLSAIERIETALRNPANAAPAAPPEDRLKVDLVEMARAIARTKAEIASIKSDGENHGRLGEASGELDSIVRATETATSDILAAAEEIQEIAWTLREQGLDGDVCDRVDAKTTEIYTACSFQDLTGQRTHKVIQVLRYLESRINAMIGVWDVNGANAETTAKGVGHSLLNGAAREGTGLDQSDIDVVMAPTSETRTFAPPQTSSDDESQDTAQASSLDAAASSSDVTCQSEEFALSPQPSAVAGVAPRSSPTPPGHSDVIENAAAAPLMPQAAMLREPAGPANGWKEPFAQIMSLSEEERIALFS